MQVTVIQHAVLADSLARVRNRTAEQPEFSAWVHRATLVLLAAATADLPIRRTEIETPVTSAEVSVLAEPPVVVPILRAGLGMLDAARLLLPAAHVSFVGLRRDERTAAAHWYFDGLPASLVGLDVIILEPMIATGGTLTHVLARLGALHPARVTVLSLLCAPQGVTALQNCAATLATPIRLLCGAVDEGLTAEHFITPGLGDAGDRMFGQPAAVMPNPGE